MDRRAKPDCLKEWGASSGVSRDFAPTQVRRRPAPTKRRWRSSSVPLGDLQRRCSDRGFTILSFAFIRVRLITQITIDVGAGGRLTTIRRNSVSPISTFHWEGRRIKGKYVFFFIGTSGAGQAEITRPARKSFAHAPRVLEKHSDVVR